MSSKQQKPKSRKSKKKSSSKQKLNQLLNDNGHSNSSKQPVDSCLRGDGFNIEQWISSSNQETDNKLSSQMLPTRAAAIKAKNGMINQGFSSYDSAKEKDPRTEINDNRLFFEEYVQPFKCIQLFNHANLEVLTYKLHSITNDNDQK